MLPAGVETVTVSSGQPMTLPDGAWIQGRITFTGPDLVTIGSDDVVLGGGVAVALKDGAFSVALVATDAVGMSPTGWTYKVTAEFTNAPGWTRYIILPKSTPTVALADVLVPDPVAGTYSILMAPGAMAPGSIPAATTTAAGIVQLDGTAADIAPLGTQAAGATGKAADAGHVHAMPRLDQVGAPTATVGLNNQKITGLANGAAATDAAAFGQIPVAGTGASNFAPGNDSRLSDARTPNPHAVTHASGGSDQLTPAAIGADTAGAATSAISTHAGAADPHGDRADAAAKYVPLTDPRLTDARTPTSHATTHATGGSDLLLPSAIGAARVADIQVFTASGTWTKPAGALAVAIHLIGGGGGGGGGRRGSAATVRCGGGGGAGGTGYFAVRPAAILTGTVAVTVGTGGLGGSAATGDGLSGGNGAPGGASSFGTYARVGASGGGSGGTASSGTAGTGGVGTTAAGGGGSASATGGPGGSGSPGVLAAAGGSSGGGITAADVAGNGGNGGANAANVNGSAGVVGGALPTAALDVATGSGLSGGGGGGGAASITAIAQTGANGGLYGGGGGGGGGSLNGFNSGAGGNGADGIAIIISYF